MEGPVDRFEFAPGRFVDLYLIRFDKDGKLLSPKTFQQFLAGAKEYTDVFVFSHGWNNVYSVAKDSYTRFIHNYIDQRKDLDLPLPETYRPALLGIIWPSTSFVSASDEGPVIAAADDESEARSREEALSFVIDGLDQEQSASLAEAIDRAHVVTGDDATALAEIVRAALVDGGDQDAGEAPTVDQIIDGCSALDQLDGAPVDYGSEGDFGTGTTGSGGTGDPSTAGGGLKNLNPLTLLRYATVWKMKGRAGIVGANGVGPALRDVLAATTDTNARVHALGHSFGARVVLAAISSKPTPRKLHSVLLLQPAINRWCFAPSVTPLATSTQSGPPGGYRVALERVETPIFTTYSDRDVPLHDIFHFVVRSNEGEVTIAAFEDDIERYGALGGYGPAGLGDELQRLPVSMPGAGYDVAVDTRVLALDGSAHDGVAASITGHGDVVTKFTAWMLHTQTAMTPSSQDV